MMQTGEHSRLSYLSKGLEYFKVGQVTLKVMPVTDDPYKMVIYSLLHYLDAMLSNLIIFYYSK